MLPDYELQMNLTFLILEGLRFGDRCFLFCPRADLHIEFRRPGFTQQRIHSLEEQEYRDADGKFCRTVA